MKFLSTTVLFVALVLTAPSSNAAAFPYITLNAKTNRVSDNGTNLTFNGQSISGPGSIWQSTVNANVPNWTSTLADNTTNSAVIINVPLWTADDEEKVIAFQMTNTTRAYITPRGAYETGLGLSWWAPDRSDVFAGVHDINAGEARSAYIEAAVVNMADADHVPVAETGLYPTHVGGTTPQADIFGLSKEYPGGVSNQETFSALTRLGQSSLSFRNDYLTDQTPFLFQPDFKGDGTGAAAFKLGTSRALTNDLHTAFSNASTNIATLDNLGNFTASLVVKGNNGISSSATDAAVSITATGWTNSFGKAAEVWFVGTNVTYTVANNAGTLIRTNITTTGKDTLQIILQTGGKMVVTSGTVSGSATPF